MCASFFAASVDGLKQRRSMLRDRIHAEDVSIVERVHVEPRLCLELVKSAFPVESYLLRAVNQTQEFLDFSAASSGFIFDLFHEAGQQQTVVERCGIQW